MPNASVPATRPKRRPKVYNINQARRTVIHSHELIPSNTRPVKINKSDLYKT